MTDLRWISLLGRFSFEGDRISFHGGQIEPSTNFPSGGVEVGNLISNRHFGGGTIEATVTFSSSDERTACGLMLFYQPATQAFIEAQLGGLSFASILTYANNQWTPHAVAGPAAQIEPNRPYHLSVSAAGSRVTVSVDKVNVLVANLPIPLPRGQAGIWCKSDGEIIIENFRITTEKPKAFVIMQFTPPFNELYAEVIKPICEKLDFIAKRADETFGPGVIIADIERQILDTQLVIADITPQNPNVYYEVGYAHALQKPTILIAESPTTLPFDVSPFRTLFYENSIAGKSRVELGLRQHLQEIASATGISPGTSESLRPTSRETV